VGQPGEALQQQLSSYIRNARHDADRFAAGQKRLGELVASGRMKSGVKRAAAAAQVGDSPPAGWGGGALRCCTALLHSAASCVPSRWAAVVVVQSSCSALKVHACPPLLSLLESSQMRPSPLPLHTQNLTLIAPPPRVCAPLPPG
jgi:hypothetical protein